MKFPKQKSFKMKEKAIQFPPPPKFFSVHCLFSQKPEDWSEEFGFLILQTRQKFPPFFLNFKQKGEEDMT